MTHKFWIVTAVAVLVALVAGASVQAQPADVDGLRVRAEQGNPSTQFSLGRMCQIGSNVTLQDNG